MKILHFLGRMRLPKKPESGGTGGTTRVALELARAQRDFGHEVYVASTGLAPWTTDWEGVTLVGLPQTRWAVLSSGRTQVDFRIHAPFVCFARWRRFDVVHGHEYPYLRFVPAALRLAHVHNNPFWTEHTPDRWQSDAPRFRILQRYSDRRIAVSAYVASQLRRGFEATGLGSPSPEATIHVVHNGVDIARFDAAQSATRGQFIRKKYNVRPEEVVFLYAGAFTPNKGVHFLVEAFQSLIAEGKAVRLILAGGAGLWGSEFGRGSKQDRTYEASVLEALRTDFADLRAIRLGIVPAEEMPGVYAASDTLVLPSMDEAHPLVALEALASGRPVIAFRVGGVPEVVSETNSILVAPGDVGALTTAMRTIVDELELRRRLSSNAALSAREMTWTRAAQRLESIYSAHAEMHPGGSWNIP